MSQLNITFPVDLRQEMRSSNANYGKVYACNFVETTLSTKGLAQHIAEHGSLVTYEVILLVLNQLSKCVPELLAQGYGVELDGLGTFYPKVENNGASNTWQEASEKGVDACVKGVHMRFRPIKEELLDLTSRNFKTKCDLVFRNVVKYQVTEDEKGRKIYKKAMQPLADFLANPLITFNYEGTSGDDNGGGDDGGDPDPVRP